MKIHFIQNDNNGVVTKEINNLQEGKDFLRVCEDFLDEDSLFKIKKDILKEILKIVIITPDTKDGIARGVDKVNCNNMLTHFYLDLDRLGDRVHDKYFTRLSVYHGDYAIGLNESEKKHKKISNISFSGNKTKTIEKCVDSGYKRVFTVIDKNGKCFDIDISGRLLFTSEDDFEFFNNNGVMLLKIIQHFGDIKIKYYKYIDTDGNFVIFDSNNGNIKKKDVGIYSKRIKIKTNDKYNILKLNGSNKYDIISRGGF